LIICSKFSILLHSPFCFDFFFILRSFASIKGQQHTNEAPSRASKASS
jgi:hypothetical protein